MSHPGGDNVKQACVGEASVLLYDLPVIRSVARRGENWPGWVPAPAPQLPSDSPGALIQRPMSPRLSSTRGAEPSCRPGELHHGLAPRLLGPPQLRWGMWYATSTGTLCSLEAAMV